MWNALRGYRTWIAASLGMAAAEAIGAVAVPFIIGIAIDDHLHGSSRGVIILAAVGISTMLLATVRRLVDVRLYARVYERISASAYEQQAGLSAKTARLNMLREVVDFVEYSLPELVGSATVFAGTLIFLAALSFPVFLGALVMTAAILGVYALTTRTTLSLNREYNDEAERQVDVLRQRDRRPIKKHISMLNHWMIKLSDLDATNVAVSVTLTVALQIFAIVTSSRHDVDHGTLLSVVLYVFEFSAVAAMLPGSWQEYLRLRDILDRLNDTGESTALDAL